MKLYKLLIICAALFQSFLCVTMDSPDIIEQLSKDAAQDKEPLCFPIQIPQDLEKYFKIPDKKLTFSPESKKQIVDTCLLTIKEKNALQKQALTEQEQRTEETSTIDVQEIIVHESKIPTAIPLQKQKTEQAQPTEKSVKKIESLHKPRKEVHPNQQEQKNIPLHLLNILRQQVGARTLNDLGAWLLERSNVHRTHPQYSDPNKGPFWREDYHTFLVPITKTATCLYSPCHYKFTALTYNFSAIMTWGPEKLHPEISCDKTCPNRIVPIQDQKSPITPLKQRFNVSELKDLQLALFNTCMRLRRNNIQECGLKWRETTHTLFIEGTNRTYMYSPCTSVIAGVPYDFNKTIAMDPKNLYPGVICDQNCQNRQL